MLLALDPLHPIVPVVVWAARALTFFNVLVLLWLGLTILLNAERRRLGTWLTGGGLLLGGACSVARASAQAAQPIELFAPLDIWWRASWLPFAGAAYLWSVVLTWYAGRLRTRAEWRSLLGLSLLGGVTFLLLLGARPPDVSLEASSSVVSSWPTSASLSSTLARVWRRPPTLSLLAFETAPGDARLALASYLTFIGLCIGLGLHALYRPANPDRFMGELAFRRARPWLTATSLVTLGLSLVVGLGVTGVPVVTPPVLLDLLGAALLVAHVVLLGQAIVSYELFTGKTLPRRGLATYWRNALILAAGFGGLLAVSLGLPLDQSYRLQLALVIVAVFYALLSWRSFVERERSLDQLRPFVASEHFIDHLLTTEPPEMALTPRPAPPPLTRHGEAAQPRGSVVLEAQGRGDVGPAGRDCPSMPRDATHDIAADAAGTPEGRGPVGAQRRSPVNSEVGVIGAAQRRGPQGRSGRVGGESLPDRGVRGADPFQALGEGVLGARVAFLLPVGPLASLVGAPQATPASAAPPSPEVLAALVERIGAARQLCLPVDPGSHGGAAWAVPLWGERSLIGLLLLGDRRDGSLYSQEEIEIARAAGERLIDARAAGELARRLLLLQRRRLAEDQLLDSRVRRVLHDDVLPLLHTALLALSSRRPDQSVEQNDAADPSAEATGLLADAHRQVAALLAALPPALAPDVARLGLVGALRRVVDDLGSELDGVVWQLDPAGERASADLSSLAAEVLFGAAREAIRNAARHARGPSPDDLQRQGHRRPLHLRVAVSLADDLVMQVEDDGIGLAGSARTQGHTRSSGQGLVLHGTLLTVLGGSLAVESAPGGGTRVTLRVPAPA